jgi:hypothetical protein
MDKLKGCVMGCAKVYVVLLLVGALSILLGDWFAVAFIIAIPTYFIVFNIRVYLYFNGQEFASMKSRISSHIKDCNDLNIHIGELKNAALVINRTDYGVGQYYDDSQWNVHRDLHKSYEPNVYHCSRTVCDNASNAPFRYICKYFGIAADEKTLEKFEFMLNDFSAAEEGKRLLMEQRAGIMQSINNEVPGFIKKHYAARLETELGFEPVDLSPISYPKYVFKYTSPAGYTGTHYDVVMDIDNLDRFVAYLSDKIEFAKSVAGQRSLMTRALREHIKERDHYTCRRCGASLAVEPHLLLEIDHIVPLSKGGMTTESNLQTLCWRCNRSKGDKVEW